MAEIKIFIKDSTHRPRSDESAAVSHQASKTFPLGVIPAFFFGACKETGHGEEGDCISQKLILE